MSNGPRIPDHMMIDWLEGLGLIRFSTGEWVDARCADRTAPLIRALSSLRRDWIKKENHEWLRRNWRKLVCADDDIEPLIRMLEETDGYPSLGMKVSEVEDVEDLPK